MNEDLKEEINVLNRNLKGLKDGIHRRNLTDGQKRFIRTYFDIINEFIGKGLDILDIDKYREELRKLED